MSLLPGKELSNARHDLSIHGNEGIRQINKTASGAQIKRLIVMGGV